MGQASADFERGDRVMTAGMITNAILGHLWVLPEIKKVQFPDSPCFCEPHEKCFSPHCHSEQTLFDTPWQCMATKSQEPAIFFTTTALVEILGLSWSGFYKLRKRGIIGPPDGYANGRPLWLREHLKQTASRIAEL